MSDRSRSPLRHVLLTGALTLVAGCYSSHELRSGAAADAGVPHARDSSVENPLPIDLTLVRGDLRISISGGRTDAQLTFQAWAANDSSESFEVAFDRAVVRLTRGDREVLGEALVSPATLTVAPGSEARNVFGALFLVPEGVLGACDSIWDVSIAAEVHLTVGDEERALPVRVDGWACSRS